MVLYDFSFKNHQISTTKNFPQEKNMFFFEPQKLKKKVCEGPYEGRSFSPSGHDGFRWCGNSSQTRRFAQNFTLQSEKLQPTFEPQNHENEALKKRVITPNNEGNVGSHGTTTLFLGKGISLGTVDLVLWQ